MKRKSKLSLTGRISTTPPSASHPKLHPPHRVMATSHRIKGNPEFTDRAAVPSKRSPDLRHFPVHAPTRQTIISFRPFSQCRCRFLHDFATGSCEERIDIFPSIVSFCIFLGAIQQASIWNFGNIMCVYAIYAIFEIDRHQHSPDKR